MSDGNLNPYAAPVPSFLPEPACSDSAEISSDNSEESPNDNGVWRDGNLLFVCKGSALPKRCVKCNEPAHRLRKHILHWHEPDFYFLLLLSPFVYLIVMQKVRQSASLSIGVCRRHLAQRSRIWSIALLLIVGGLAMIFLAACLRGPARQDFALPVLLFGVAMITVGVCYGIIWSRLLWAKRIDADFAWINGASPEFLASLPEVPPHLSSASSPQ
jgi:hypothetical protein